ncbi:MAG: hypothetical protein L0H96_21780 [Humibacillus sp.]|nr:hypothetical protein [Humibacillus sp.]MDN5779527.1 hypothetical protein [Humibacillus sp.]
MRTVRNVTTATASVVVCVALGACTSPTPYQIEGHEVTDLSGSLDYISARWRATLTGLGTSVNLPAGARCYVEGAGGRALGTSVICGPVRLAGDGETTWQTHAVVGSTIPSGVWLILSGGDAAAEAPTFHPRSAADLTAHFIDAHGITAPLDQELEPPAVDRAAADDPRPLTAPFRGGSPLSVRTPSGPVSLTVALTSGLIGPVGQQVTPPTGGSFLLVTGNDLPDAAADDVDVSLVVSHDGTNVSLPLDQLAEGMAVGLPKGAGPVTLGVGYDGLVQRFDAASGHRLGDPAASLYDGIGDTATASCPAVVATTGAPGAVAAGNWRQRFTCRVTVTRSSYLPEPPDGSPRTVQGWAKDGQTWAAVAIEPDEQTTWLHDGEVTRYTPTYFSFGTRLRVAGVEYAPRQLFVEQAEGGRTARVTAIFEVRAGQRSMTLHSFVTTNLASSAAPAGVPASGAFTYPADSTVRFGGAIR